MGKKIYFAVFLLLALSFGGAAVYAENKQMFNQSGQPIPRFISLNKDKVFMRSGPGQRYPIKWIFRKKGLPIEVVQEFDTWRKIRDADGEEGWIHQSMLSGRRKAIVQSEENAILYRKPSLEARPLSALEPNVIVILQECLEAWCYASAGGYEGWVEKKSLWGVYADEKFD